MSVIILDGKKLAIDFNSQTKKVVTNFTDSYSRSPKFLILLVGSDEVSFRYDNLKVKLANSLGIDSTLVQLPIDISETQLLNKISEVSEENDSVLVQFPLPESINANHILNSIDPLKEVDGIHPYHLAKLFDQKEVVEKINSLDEILPVTPMAIVLLILEARRILGQSSYLSGVSCVVCGRSKLVGIPVSLLLQGLGATVTVCHSETLEHRRKKLVSEADIVVSAVGVPNFIALSELKTGAICIDVANNYNEQGKVSGDIEYDIENPKISAITPVPGGVGPMTLAVLMRNVINSAIIQEARK